MDSLQRKFIASDFLENSLGTLLGVTNGTTEKSCAALFRKLLRHYRVAGSLNDPDRRRCCEGIFELPVDVTALLLLLLLLLLLFLCARACVCV